jgi:hypothetical protein
MRGRHAWCNACVMAISSTDLGMRWWQRRILIGHTGKFAKKLVVLQVMNNIMQRMLVINVTGSFNYPSSIVSFLVVL